MSIIKIDFYSLKQEREYYYAFLTLKKKIPSFYINVFLIISSWETTKYVTTRSTEPGLYLKFKGI